MKHDIDPTILYKFDTLQSFLLEKQDCKSFLRVVLSATSEPETVLSIIFNGVMNLQISALCDSNLLQIEIENIRSWQQEDLFYKVTEAEYETFSFCCKSYDFDILKKI
jgi:hypothetical protein